MQAGRAAAARAAKEKNVNKTATSKLLLAEEKAQTAEKVDEWFRKYDRDENGILDRDELKQLLTSVANGKPPSDTVLESAFAPAKESGANGITKEVASDIVVKTVSYIKDQGVIDTIFAKYDTDGNGGLDQNELLHLLQSVARHNNVDPEEVTTEDVTQVLEMADADGTGLIERNEVLFACARWKNMHMNKPSPSKPTSSACALL